MGNVCHDCGREYERLTMHWNRTRCKRLSFTSAQVELLTGLLMGDGDLHRRGDPNPLFRIRMTNREFLEYLDGCLGVLSRGVFLDRSADEMASQAKSNKAAGLENFETVNEENYNDLYGLRTVSHPDLHQFTDWYSSGTKRFPPDLELTPEIAKMWYVCDGWIASDSRSTDSDRVMVKAKNEADRQEYLVNLFEAVGFKAGFSRYAIQISAEETEDILDWMGPAPPGFEYKWRTKG